MIIKFIVLYFLTHIAESMVTAPSGLVAGTASSTRCHAYRPFATRTGPVLYFRLNVMSLPISIVVRCEVHADRIDDFLAAIKIDCLGSRDEPGCLRFDVIRSHDDPNVFYFYEQYTNQAAIAQHKKEKHFEAWSTFKATGGVASLTVTVGDSLY